MHWYVSSQTALFGQEPQLAFLAVESPGPHATPAHFGGPQQ
jgi:hypothetical protein